jgi:hypothetical protein
MNVAMLYDEQSGHDALLEGVEIDARNNTLSINLFAYPTHDAAQRIPIKIEFSDLKSVAMQADMVRLAENRSAGTVNHWRIAEEPGTSYFYLIEGYLAVESGSVPKLIQA